MSFLLFFGRRLLSGFVAKMFSSFLVKRFKVSGGVASLVFVIITELLARFSEKAVPDAQVKAAAKQSNK